MDAGLNCSSPFWEEVFECRFYLIMLVDNSLKSMLCDFKRLGGVVYCLG